MDDIKAISADAPRAIDGASGTRVGSIVQALAVLRHLSESGESRGVTAIAHQLGISPSSCFNILKTLASEDVVEFDPRTKTYRIGFGLLHIVRTSLSRSQLLPRLLPDMQALASQFSAAIGLWRISREDRPLLIGLAENEAATRIHLTIGQRLPSLAGAVGRCIAAHRLPPRAELSRDFARLRLDQPITLDQFVEEVDQARRCGYAVDADCYMRGVTSVAAPVAEPDGPGFCLSATMFSGQHDGEAIVLIGQVLRELARKADMLA